MITFHQIGHYLVREDVDAEGSIHYSVKNIIADEMYEELQYGRMPILDENKRIPQSLDDALKSIYVNR